MHLLPVLLGIILHLHAHHEEGYAPLLQIALMGAHEVAYPAKHAPGADGAAYDMTTASYGTMS